jgi:hypothetical protein
VLQGSTSSHGEEEMARGCSAVKAEGERARMGGSLYRRWERGEPRVVLDDAGTRTVGGGSCDDGSAGDFGEGSEGEGD